MPTPFMAGDSPRYGNTAEYYYPPPAGSVATPYLNGSGMPMPIVLNQFGSSTPPHHHPHPHPHPHHHHVPPPPHHLGHPLPHPHLQPPPPPPHPQGYYLPPPSLPPPPQTGAPPPHPPPALSHPQHISTPPSLASSLPPSALPSLAASQAASSQMQMMSPATTGSSPSLDQEYCDFLYHVGFIQGRLADTMIHVPHLAKTYSLHALILARSPTLHRLLLDQHQPQKETTATATATATTSKKYDITLKDVPRSISEEAMNATLGHLYRPMTHQDVMYLFARPRILLSILDVAEYLEIQPLTTMIYEALGHEWNVETILFWLPYLCNIQGQGRLASLEFALHYLTQTLPRQLEAFYGDQWMDLAHVYAHLPLGLLERCIEHERLGVRDPMQRFEFSKQVMALRKQNMEKDDGVSVALRFHQGEVAVKVIHP